MILTMLVITLINRVTCQENVFDVDFGDEPEKEKVLEMESPEFKFEGKNSPYDARSFKNSGCELSHSLGWGGWVKNPKCDNYHTFFFFSFLTASLSVLYVVCDILRKNILAPETSGRSHKDDNLHNQDISTMTGGPVVIQTDNIVF